MHMHSVFLYKQKHMSSQKTSSPIYTKLSNPHPAFTQLSKCLGYILFTSVYVL